MLVRYSVTSLESFRTTDEQARRYLLEDLRKTEKLSYPELAFILKLNRHVPPNDQKTSEKNIRFTELDIPQALLAFRPLLAQISAALHPEQEMVNWIAKQRAIAAAKDPPYVPYLVPQLTDQPWMLPQAEHVAARSTWMSFSKQAKRSTCPQELSIQAFTLYHMRFIFAAELCGAFELFGGIALQLSHLSTVLNISITDSAGIALAYHRILTGKLQERARQRSAKVEDFSELLAAECFIVKEQAKREISAAIEKDKRDQPPRTSHVNHQLTNNMPTNRRRPYNRQLQLRPRSRSRSPPSQHRFQAHSHQQHHHHQHQPANRQNFQQPQQQLERNQQQHQHQHQQNHHQQQLNHQQQNHHQQNQLHRFQAPRSNHSQNQASQRRFTQR